MQVPCGNCIGCRMDYSKMWMARITHESTKYANNAFLTLTYNPEHLPYKQTVDKETGELKEGNPLVKKHIVDFVKRLRYYYDKERPGEKIRFYACGEYGTKYGRPHYHMAIFNYDSTCWGDIKLRGNNHQGDALWSSEKLEQIWGKGFVTIGDLTPQSAAYIARYMLKKQKGKEKKYYYEKEGIIQEYTTMSRMPGIGLDWYEQHKEEIWLRDCIYVPQRNKAPLKIKVPRYYNKQLEKEDEEKLKRIKEARKKSAELNQKLANSRTTATEWEQLKAKENKEADKLKGLVRGYETF